MSERDNKTPLPTSSRDEVRKKPPSRELIDETIDKLRNSPKCREWFPKFARNLGEMAEQLDPSQPKDAARRMFMKAFGNTADAAWRKRKRYLRYSGEETDFVNDGEYASSVDPYIRLADAFAKLRFPSDEDAVRKANRLLVKGTSLDPRPSIDVSKIDGLTHALDCLKLILDKCKADSEIATALSYLNLFPIAPFGTADKLEGKIFRRFLTRTGLFEDSIGIRGEGLSIVSAPISTITACRDLEDIQRWYAGRVLLGYVYLPEIISVVNLRMSPEECIKKLEKLEEKSESSSDDEPALDFLIEAASDIIDKFEIEDFDIGDEYFESKPVPRLLQHTAFIRKRVYLILDYQADKLQLKLDISGERNSLGFIDNEPEVFKRGDAPNMDEMIMPCPDAYEGIDVKLMAGVSRMEDWAYRLVKHTRWAGDEEQTYVIGGPEWRRYNTRAYSASLDDDDIKSAIFEGANPLSSEFTPMVWDDLSQLSAAPHGSIAATILRNMALAPEDERIDTILLNDAHKRLNGIVSFVREKLQITNTALFERGLEP